MDSVTVDLGYIQNAAYTLKQGNHKDVDDQFSIKVEVQMADHPLTAHDSEHEVFVAVKFGDTIVVGKLEEILLKTKMIDNYINYHFRL